jgi:hypothetical protein
MQGSAVIEPGTCGFTASVVATVEGGREARFAVESDCEHVAAMAAALAEQGPFDVYEEMDWRAESRLRVAMRESLKGSYSWCPVPVGLLKAMQVAAGMSLADEMAIKVSKGGGESTAAEGA